MPLPKLPKKDITTIAICISVLLAFALLLLWPTYRSLAVVQEETEALRVKLEKQRILGPVFEKLLQQVRAEVDEPGLPFPEKTRMPREETGQISEKFQKLAEEAGFVLDDVLPDAHSLAEESRFLLVNVTVTGDYFKLRRLLTAIGELSYLEHLEQVRIETIPGGKQVHLRIWLAQE